LAIWPQAFLLLTIVTLSIPAQAESIVIATDISPTSTSFSSQRKIVRDREGNLFAVYLKMVDDFSQVYLSQSDNNGTSWREVGQISQGSYSSVRVTIAIDSHDQLHIFWTKFIEEYGQIFYRTYGRAGWSEEYQMTTGSAYSGFPSAALDSKGRLHLVWYGYDGVAYQVFYTRLEGTNWSVPLKLSQGFPDSVNPTIAVDSSDNIHVAWYKSNGRRYQINYIRWSDRWGEQLLLSSGSEDAFNPSIAIDSKDNVYIVWDAGEGPRTQIYYAVYHEGKWSEQEPLTSGGADARNPSVAVDARDAVYVLYDKTDGQVYVRRFFGAWSAEEMLTISGENTFPSVRWSFYNNPFNAAGGQVDYVWTSIQAEVANLMYNALPVIGQPKTETLNRQPLTLELVAIVVAGILLFAFFPRILSMGTRKTRSR